MSSTGSIEFNADKTNLKFDVADSHKPEAKFVSRARAARRRARVSSRRWWDETTGRQESASARVSAPAPGAAALTKHSSLDRSSQPSSAVDCALAPAAASSASQARAARHSAPAGAFAVA